MPESILTEEEQEKLGRFLAAQRRGCESDITQGDIADAVDKHKSAVSQVENGNHSSAPIIKAIINLSNAHEALFENEEIKDIVSKVLSGQELQDIREKAYGEDAADRVYRPVDRIRTHIDKIGEAVTDVQGRISDIVDEEVGERSLEAITLLLPLLEEENSYLPKHAVETAVLGHVLGKHLNFSRHDLSVVEKAGLFSDFGMLRVPKHIRTKQDELNKQDWKEIHRHPKKTINLLEPYIRDDDVLETIRKHHEQPNQGGYPKGIKKVSIPETARVVSMADTFSALINDRPWRDAMDVESALGEALNDVEAGRLAQDSMSVLVTLVEDQDITVQNGYLSVNVSISETEFLSRVDTYVEDYLF